MTIEQTVEIPVDHRVLFEFQVPNEIPAGKARLELKVTPIDRQETISSESAVSAIDNEKSIMDSFSEILSGKPTPHADRLLGIANGLGDISHDEIRSERLSKYFA